MKLVNLMGICVGGPVAMTDARKQALQQRRAELRSQRAARRDLDKVLRYAQWAVFTAEGPAR